MQDIVSYDISQSPQEVIRSLHPFLYGKRAFELGNILEEEIPVINNAIDFFVKNIGQISIPSGKFSFYIGSGHPDYIYPEIEYDGGKVVGYNDFSEKECRYLYRIVEDWIESTDSLGEK